MLKRIFSSVIIFSMLWGDIAAAMDDQEESPLPISTSLVVKKRSNTSLSPKTGTTEKDPLLNGERKDPYNTLTPMREIASSIHSINEVERSGSSDEEERENKRDCSSSEFRDPLEKRATKNKTYCCWPPSCCKSKQILILDRSDSDEESCCFSNEHKKPCCWSPSWPSCCRKGSSEKFPREREHLLLVENDTPLAELKKQLLLKVVIPSEEDRSNSSDVIRLEEQPLEEQEILFQKARFLFQKIQGTSLEDFGRWFQGHVVENRYTWKDWAGIGIALGMAAGTGAAMSPVAIWSIYNKYLVKYLKGDTPYAISLAYYINTSTGLTAFTDAASFMPEATSPSTGTFTTSKSAREKRADRALISLAAIPGIYLLLLGFQVQQEHKRAMSITGWWNEYDRYFYFSSLGFFPYLVAQTWKGMRTAVSKVFHPTVPEHVKDRVLALRQLDARLNHLSDDAIDDLYDLLKDPLYSPHSNLKAWARYLCQGEISDFSKIEGLLSYLSLTKYAQNIMTKEVEPEEDNHNTRKAARILAGSGLPAGFSLVAISVFGLLSAFMDWKGALALSITAAALGFVPEAFFQSHNVQDTLDDISAKESGAKRGWKETLKDPYWWGAGAAKVLGTVWAFFQNALTNLAPIFVSLALLIPEQLGGSDTLQTVMTSLMIAVAVPYLISELLSGTHDMWGHVVNMTYAVQDFLSGIYDRIVRCCKKEVSLSPHRQKREIRRILRKTIETTVRFTPEHVEELERFERRLSGEEVFD